MARFCQKKQANLCDVCAGRYVNQIVFGVSFEGIASCEFVELLVDLFEVPWIGEFDLMELCCGFRGGMVNVVANGFSETHVSNGMQEFETVDNEVRLAAKRNGRAPVLPAVARFACIQLGAEKTDHDASL